MSGFIGVHVGAGNHSERSEDRYLKICRKACEEVYFHGINILKLKMGTLVLKRGGSALEAVTAATTVLENSPLTNAGLGSNLTWDGLVECDAMVMDGQSLHYGAVGAVPGIKNPIHLAKHLCQQQSIKDLQYGRVKPSTMVSEGARKLAESAGIETVCPTKLISARALKLYNRYKQKIAKMEKETQEQSILVTDAPLDTVGAVCIDVDGNVAASCSSGGIVLKTPGRVGQAGMYGCGCWAENAVANSPAVASSTTGCGEHLIRTMLGQEAALSVQSSDCPAVCLHHVMKNKFLESPFLHDVDEKLAGVILIKCSVEEGGEFLWAHTTQTMCTGFMATTDKHSKSHMSRLPVGVVPGRKAVVEGIHFKWKNKDDSLLNKI